MDDSRADELWPHIFFHPDINPTFEEQVSGLYELVIKRDPSCERWQPVFVHFPGEQKFRSNDLFSPHPSLSGFWQHQGRSDDIIVLLNGEKFNPVGFESHLAGHPDVAAALMFGTDRFETGTLVELFSPMESELAVRRSEIVEKLWPSISQANALVPAYAQVAKSHVCFTSQSKPMKRAGKGTVQRRATLDLYAQEIDDLYRDVGLMKGVSDDGQVRTIDFRDVGSVSLAVRSALEMFGLFLSDETDFFAVGMDSLQVLRLVRHMRAVTSLDTVEPRLVYLNPSTRALAQAIVALNQEHSLQLQTPEKRKDSLRL